MASWLKERNNANELKKGILGENLNLDEAFLSVESINQCVELFHHYKLIGNNDLDIEKIDFLMNLCGRLRKKGLGLEPNIIGRAVAWIVLDRDLAGSVSIRFAKTDTDFHRLTIEADTARDRGDFADAQYFYWQALQLFPFHSNIRVQYAHSLKEQGLMAQALLEYIDAYYFGASKEHVEIHALFVADAINRHADVVSIFKRKALNNGVLDWFVSSKDVITLTNLLLGRAPSIDQIVTFMCECKNKRELLYKLVGMEDFVRTHRDTLRLLNETNWSVK